MKILILFLLLPFMVFAQYGSNEVPNGTFDSNVTGWSGVVVTILHYSTDDDGIGRTNTLKDTSSGSSNARIEGTMSGIVVSSTYKIKMIFYYDSGSTANGFQPSVFGDGAQQFFTAVYGAVGSWRTINEEVVMGGSHTTYGLYINEGTTRNGGLDGDVSYIDNVGVRLRIDTLYIDSSMPDDTDNDTTKTVKGGFDRGAHAGGYFDLIGDHTGEDKATLDSSGTKIYTSQTANIDTIDFNSTTWIVDLADLTIIIKLNDSNVTYLNTPSVTNTYQSRNKRTGRATR